MTKTKNKTINRPRLAVFRSNKYLYVQIIDDTKAETLVSIDKATDPVEAGKNLASAALKKKISIVVFDRRGYKYHGNIKRLADAAREAGLKF